MTEQAATQAHATRGFTIVVNGTTAVVEDDLVSYEQVVRIAFPDITDPNVLFSVAYRKASGPRGGTGNLGPGGSVQVKKNGTSFSVTATTRS